MGEETSCFAYDDAEIARPARVAGQGTVEKC